MPRRQIPVRGASRQHHITPDQLVELRQQIARVKNGDNAAELCFCLCHDSHDARHSHFGACCRRCPTCDERIIESYYETHAARHQSETSNQS